MTCSPVPLDARLQRASPRMAFQWSCLAGAQGSVLNVGCSADPLQFEDRCTHFDCDDWVAYFSKLSDLLGKVIPFVQGDAHELDLYFAPGEFDTVIMGDIVEHLVDPYKAISAAASVTNRALCLTIWEEWRLPGFGKFIQEGQAEANKEAQGHGHAGYLEHHKALYPIVTLLTEEELPHHCHIWQFSDEMIASIIGRIMIEHKMKATVFAKVGEQVHAGHQVYNWLVYLVKEEPYGG